MDAEGKRDGFILRKGEILGGVENAEGVRLEGCSLRWQENFDDVIAASALLGMGGKPDGQYILFIYFIGVVQ